MSRDLAKYLRYIYYATILDNFVTLYDNRGMEIHSYTIIHYGADYLPYALRSVQNHVDKMHVIYTAHPSHGTQTNAKCPERIIDIQRSIYENSTLNLDTKRIRFYESKNMLYEGKQRDQAIRTCRKAGADIILVLDYDEIWQSETLKNCLDRTIKTNNPVQRINFTHLWRSFNWCCRDDGWPDRIIKLSGSGNIGHLSREYGEAYHFGYAIRDEIMRYKWQIHGHKGEMRESWLEWVWEEWGRDNIIDCVHPTNEKNFWTPQPFDKSTLPDFMQSHPFYGLEKIE